MSRKRKKKAPNPQPQKPTTVREVEEIYARIPAIECKGFCGQDICGPVNVLRKEVIYLRYHKVPKVKTACKPGTLECSYLTKDNRCSIYKHRPAVCRFWFTEKGMPLCPHGCRPERFMTKEEIYKLMSELL